MSTSAMHVQTTQNRSHSSFNKYCCTCWYALMCCCQHPSVKLHQCEMHHTDQRRIGLPFFALLAELFFADLTALFGAAFAPAAGEAGLLLAFMPLLLLFLAALPFTAATAGC
jgi:hypothetical protein